MKVVHRGGVSQRSRCLLNHRPEPQYCRLLFILLVVTIVIAGKIPCGPKNLHVNCNMNITSETELVASLVWSLLSLTDCECQTPAIDFKFFLAAQWQTSGEHWNCFATFPPMQEEISVWIVCEFVCCSCNSRNPLRGGGVYKRAVWWGRGKRHCIV